MAFMDEQIILDWKANEYSQIPQEKIQELEEECRFIREKEIAFAKEPLVPSVSSVAIPVLNYQKKLLGTITVVGFTEVVPQDENNELSQYLIQISNEISASFGYQSQLV
jgi:DNA-binding IclR family transcriptional regulator